MSDDPGRARLGPKPPWPKTCKEALIQNVVICRAVKQRDYRAVLIWLAIVLLLLYLTTLTDAGGAAPKG